MLLNYYTTITASCDDLKHYRIIMTIMRKFSTGSPNETTVEILDASALSPNSQKVPLIIHTIAEGGIRSHFLNQKNVAPLFLF